MEIERFILEMLFALGVGGAVGYVFLALTGFIEETGCDDE